jgi:hypothetical protein
MLTLRRFLLVLSLVAVPALGCDDANDLTEPEKPPTQVLPPSGYSHGDSGPPSVMQPWTDAMAGKPWSPSGPMDFRRLEYVSGARPFTPQPGPVELRQQRLDHSPAMGPCPVWGAPAGSGWTQIFRHTFPLPAAPEGQPNNCQQVPPQSWYGNLQASGNLYPSGWAVNDNIRAFFVWANILECVRVKFWQHPWDFAGGGHLMTYQVCGTTNSQGYMWSGNLSTDAGFTFNPSQMSVERWTY